MKLFDVDGRFFNLTTKIMNLVIINVLFVLCCIPIITIGAATTAMYSVTLKMARDQEGYIVRSFFKSFKENFKQATIIWCGALLALVILFTDIKVMSTMDQWRWGLIPIYIILFFLIMLLLFTFPLLAQFAATIKQTLKNAMLVELSHLPYLFLIIIIHGIPVFITVTQPIVVDFAFVIWGAIGFSTIALTCSYIFANRIFPKYIDAIRKGEEE